MGTSLIKSGLEKSSAFTVMRIKQHLFKKGFSMNFPKFFSATTKSEISSRIRVFYMDIFYQECSKRVVFW